MMTVSRDVLESLPQSVYRSLPWAAHTIDSCVKIVAEAQRTNNPRRVRAWLDFERTTPSGDEILGCLDSVVEELTQPGEKFADRVRFADKIRQEARDYVRTSGALAAAANALDPHASAAADGLLAALRVIDPVLAEHSEIAAQLATRLAVAIGLDAATAARVTLTARLHDIGKMRTAERDFERYPAIGAEMLAALPALAAIAPLVRAQRERFDGSGSPDGAAKAAIPLESRIVAVVDAFHAMSLDGPYRKARSTNEAIAEIIIGSGSQFDPELVVAFSAMIGYRGHIAQSA